MKSDDTRKSELDEFEVNITVLSFIDAIRKCILGSSMEEVDDSQKQVRAIRSLEQLKICDLHYFDHYVDLFYKYWSQIGRPYDENLLMKFVTKLPGKIGEKLYKDLTEWFKSRKEEGLFWQISLIPAVEFVRKRIRELCDEEKLRRQAQQQFSRMCVDLYEVPTLGC